MTRKNKGTPIFGMVLLIIGVMLLLSSLEVWRFHWSYILLVLGLFFFALAVSSHDKGSVFPGTILFLLGLFYLLKYHDIIYGSMFRLWPIFPAIVGVAFIVLFIVKPAEWGLLIPGGILLFFAIIFLAYNYDLFEIDPGYIIGHYWPLILIAVGAKLLADAWRRPPSKRSTPQDVMEEKKEEK
jgi:hypothetical protein